MVAVTDTEIQEGLYLLREDGLSGDAWLLQKACPCS